MTKYGSLSPLLGPSRSKYHAKRNIKSIIISVALGLLATYFVISIMIIEVRGRRGVKTADEWRALIKEHPYKRTPTDVRSPCPMLNTLANHGFIARDGRNIKSEELFNALMLMGAPPTVTVMILKFVYSQLNEANPHDSFFAQFNSLKGLDLDRLTVFGILEHDVSLTRNDFALEHKDTSNVVPQYVHRMLRLAERDNKGEFQGLFTRENENNARKLRWMESVRDNRHMHLNLFSQFASSTECSLLLDIIGRDGRITLPHLESFLLNETFPEDWLPRETTYSLVELATKPMICWHGVRKSQVPIELISELQ